MNSPLYRIDIVMCRLKINLGPGVTVGPEWKEDLPSNIDLVICTVYFDSQLQCVQRKNHITVYSSYVQYLSELRSFHFSVNVIRVSIRENKVKGALERRSMQRLF
jgi:hypothetical protein